jgi:hypothetical protein
MSRHPIARRLLLVGVLAAPWLGCGTTLLVAPPGREVYIMQTDTLAQVHVERTVWFYQWGAKPFNDNTTQEDIEKYNLREVRMDAYQKWYEMLLNPIMSIVSIQRRTLVVEGNP